MTWTWGLRNRGDCAPRPVRASGSPCDEGTRDFGDLHFSEGTFTPEKESALAEAANFRALVSLTGHTIGFSAGIWHFGPRLWTKRAPAFRSASGTVPG